MMIPLDALCRACSRKAHAASSCAAQAPQTWRKPWAPSSGDTRATADA